MGRGLRGAKPAPIWPKPLEGIEATRDYVHAFIAALKDCGHQSEHVRQVLREMLYGADDVRAVDGAQSLLADLDHRARYWRQPGIGDFPPKDLAVDFAEELERAARALRTSIGDTPAPQSTDGGEPCCGFPVGGPCPDCPDAAGVRACAECGYQHGHAIGCANNPVDIALAVCQHGIHMDNACGACVPPRGTTVRPHGVRVDCHHTKSEQPPMGSGDSEDRGGV